MHFVALTQYTEEFGKPDNSEITYEIIDGVSVAGVNVLTGREGWYKRINRDIHEVKKSAELTDVNIDPSGQAVDRIFSGTKKQIMKPTPTAVRQVMLHPSAASSASSSKQASVNGVLHCVC